MVLAGHAVGTILEALDQPVGPMESAFGRVQPQSNNRAHRAPGGQVGIGRQLRGDACLPLLHRMGASSEQVDRFGAGQVLDETHRCGEQVEPWIVAGERHAKHGEVRLLAVAGDLVLPPRWSARFAGDALVH
ncbi:MAG: hypothetical protein ACT4PW_00860 [Acidimicrobiia bacterium]